MNNSKNTVSKGNFEIKVSMGRPTNTVSNVLKTVQPNLNQFWSSGKSWSKWLMAFLFSLFSVLFAYLVLDKTQSSKLNGLPKVDIKSYSQQQLRKYVFLATIPVGSLPRNAFFSKGPKHMGTMIDGQIKHLQNFPTFNLMNLNPQYKVTISNEPLTGFTFWLCGEKKYDPSILIQSINEGNNRYNLLSQNCQDVAYTICKFATGQWDLNQSLNYLGMESEKNQTNSLLSNQSLEELKAENTSEKEKNKQLSSYIEDLLNNTCSLARIQEQIQKNASEKHESEAKTKNTFYPIDPILKRLNTSNLSNLTRIDKGGSGLSLSTENSKASHQSVDQNSLKGKEVIEKELFCQKRQINQYFQECKQLVNQSKVR